MFAIPKDLRSNNTAYDLIIKPILNVSVEIPSYYLRSIYCKFILFTIKYISDKFAILPDPTEKV